MKLPRAKNIDVQKYMAGPSFFRKRKAKIKLSANESALGPSPKAVKEYINNSKSFKRYPDSNGTLLRNILANKFKIDPTRIILGAGSDQILEFVCKAFLKKNDEVIISLSHIDHYRIYANIVDAKVKFAKEDNLTVSFLQFIFSIYKKN